MKKTLISGLLASAGLLATSSGAAVLPSHAAQDSTSTATKVKSGNSDSHQSDSEQKPFKPIRVPGESEQAKLISKVNPVYPPAAKKAGVQGVVLLDVTISKEGVPEDIQVLESPNDDLTQSAEEAVRQWRYSTTLLNGQPVPVIAEVKVNYTLTK
ncbi:MAG TPA: energy transducer TonB, partial [Bryobacteraceae bacterium]|nr:energy transducer TonB [Bryobacteraceae bacterium]